MNQTYRIRVSHQLGPALCTAFAEMHAVVVPRQTVIEGWLSREEFLELLRRVDQVGLELVRVECASGGNPLLGDRDLPGSARWLDPPGPY